jgi:hypothetical protein
VAARAFHDVAAQKIDAASANSPGRLGKVSNRLLKKIFFVILNEVKDL